MNEQKKHKETYTVYLNGTSYGMQVSQEGYSQILAIAQATAVCDNCKEHYSEANPQVAGLRCLRCFQATEGTRRDLTYKGRLDPRLDWKRHRSLYAPFESVIYFFMNNEGHIYTTEAGPGRSQEASEDIAITLKYWSFPRPEQAERNGEAINVSGYDWTIYGDVSTHEVLIIQHGCKFHKNELLFMVTRYGQAVQMSMRRPLDRQILKDARAELQATRAGDAYIYDSDIYELAAQRLSEALAARHAANHAEQLELLPEQTETEQEPQAATE